MINGPLMKLMFKRFAWIYWFILAFWLLGGGAFILGAAATAPINIEIHRHPFFSIGIFISLIWGMGIFTREFTQGGIMEFVMARPVSRGEFYNTVLLSAAIPMLVLMFMPVLYTITLFPWFHFTPPLDRQLLICLMAGAWVVVILLLGINIGLFAAAHKGVGRALSAFVLALLVAVFMNVGVVIQPDGADTGRMILQRPLQALAAALLPGALLYYLGRRRVERMDI